MKPKTKLHHEIIDKAQYLFKIDNKILSWVKADCLEHKGFATKTRVICMDCGRSFSPELVSRKRASCPHCNTKLKIEQTKKRTDKQHIFVGYADIVDRFQVLRYFEVIGYYKAGEPSRYYTAEIIQQWILPNGKHEYYGQNHTLNSHADSWNGPMEIRKYYPNYYTPSDKYEVYPKKYHPDSEFKPEYKKYGIDSNLRGLTFLEAIKLLPESPMAETLLKAKQYSLLGRLNDHYGATYRYWPSIKICLRNKYFIKDARYYIDYLELLEYFGKDLRNAHYVCPKNLKKEHDLLVAKRKRQRDREQAASRREKLLKEEKVFEKLKKSMLTGIAFSDGKIKVHVLENVKEYIEEGDALHHCVASYALREDSLVLSARIRGKRIETVEVSLKQLKVVQCRGLQNRNTEYHDQIIELVNKNMHVIKERLQSKSKKQVPIKDVSHLMPAVLCV